LPRAPATAPTYTRQEKERLSCFQGLVALPPHAYQGGRHEKKTRMAPTRRFTTASLFDKVKLLAFLEEGLGADTAKKRDTAARHCRAILAAATKDAESGRATLDLSEARLPNLPRFAREGIPTRFQLMTTTIADCRTSRDGSTTKMVVELQDGHRVESVVMRHDKGRVTLCVSSQVGCKMGCTFCATGTLGELGNLTCGEVLEQLVHAQRLFAPGGVWGGLHTSSTGKQAEAAAGGGGGRGGGGGATPTHISGTGKGVGVRNVVFMGMGEPLNNYDAVLASLGPMTDPQCFAIAPSRCTVSTVGVIPNMRRLVTDAPGVGIALSLHAPNQALREKIVPTATAYKLPALMEALDHYLASVRAAGRERGVSGRGGGGRVGYRRQSSCCGFYFFAFSSFTHTHARAARLECKLS
jgi:hypothetical protein